MGGERVRVEGGAARCPFCHDGLEKVDELVACAPCGARFHAACHRDNQERCPSCGASEVLVPPRPRSRRKDPPKGSRIEVRREAERTSYSWDTGSGADRFLIIVFALLVVTLPVAAWMWHARRKVRRAELLLEPGRISFDALDPNLFFIRRVVAAAEDVGGARVGGSPGTHGPALAIDVGLTRHRVLAGLTHSSLTAPELEWLAEEIQAWKAQQEG